MWKVIPLPPSFTQVIVFPSPNHKCESLFSSPHIHMLKVIFLPTNTCWQHAHEKFYFISPTHVRGRFAQLTTHACEGHFLPHKNVRDHILPLSAPHGPHTPIRVIISLRSIIRVTAITSIEGIIVETYRDEQAGRVTDKEAWIGDEHSHKICSTKVA